MVTSKYSSRFSVYVFDLADISLYHILHSLHITFYSNMIELFIYIFCSKMCFLFQIQMYIYLHIHLYIYIFVMVYTNYIFIYNSYNLYVLI